MLPTRTVLGALCIALATISCQFSNSTLWLLSCNANCIVLSAAPHTHNAAPQPMSIQNAACE
ncbi:hypothetical protein BU25DRAFT_413226 [Macroventuria anomochaeta]|uniref:Uncharacterized protein n=1 Tax=Macroventuria anomochaeta TaxID=301207 RepID=A0ACB6RS99_9PLEO|nr:uncharacterized protein BU25DRAFT_413226 [Macroventuria anomochaeta]KAF2624678.1 hypothetical protein BU25DRAFT_413226 [Macroventuria anomochaeta]